MKVRIDPSWQRVLQAEFDKPYFELLTQYVRQQYQTRRCFPPAGLIFNAFDSCPFDKVRVVIIGQDPYHEEGQAMGLSFSVPDGVQIPPSLVNIYKEIHRDLGTPIPATGDLRRWAEQGVLLLNATLTVEAHKAGSHQGKGWEELTDAAIEAADVVLMDDDPLKISKAIKISRKCMCIVYENIIFAIGVKVLCLLLGALGIANMWIAIFADVGVMIIAVLNAIRALFVKKM